MVVGERDDEGLLEHHADFEPGCVATRATEVRLPHLARTRDSSSSVCNAASERRFGLETAPKVSVQTADMRWMNKKTPTARDVHDVFAACDQTLELICRLRGIELHDLDDRQVNEFLFAALDEYLGSEAIVGELLNRKD
jgi:hypothetical protein